MITYAGPKVLIAASRPVLILPFPLLRTLGLCSLREKIGLGIIFGLSVFTLIMTTIKLYAFMKYPVDMDHESPEKIENLPSPLPLCQSKLSMKTRRANVEAQSTMTRFVVNGLLTSVA